MTKVTETRGAKAGRASAADVARRGLYAEVGARIRKVRTELEIGQAECARAASIDVSSMYRIESGGQNLTVETLARLALALGVTIDHLLVGVVPDPDIIEARSRS